MEIDELTQRVLHQKRMEELESKPAAPYDPSEGMTTMEEASTWRRRNRTASSRHPCRSR